MVCNNYFLSIGNKPARDLQSASTVVLGANSNTNLNNNNGPNNSLANFTDDNKNASSASKVDVGHVVSTASTDSVFVRNEALDTGAHENVAETPAAHSVQFGESANQEPTITESNETTEPEQKGEAGDEVSSKQPEVAAVEDNVARPPSSASRKEIDECNSVSQLPKVIVKKSINAAVNRLSLQKDSSTEGDNVETNGIEDGNSADMNEEQGTQSEAVPHEDQVNEPSQEETHEQINEEERGEDVQESQPEASHEGQATEVKEVKDTNSGEDVTAEPQEAESPATNTQSEGGEITEEAHINSSTTDTAASEDSSNHQESPATNGDTEVVENGRKDEVVAEQVAPASGDRAIENNTDDQAGNVDTMEPMQAEEKNEGEEADGGSGETPEEVTASGDSEELAIQSDVQKTQNEQQQEDDPSQ